MKLILPWPVSINAYWKTRVIILKGHKVPSTYVSSEGVQFQKDVQAAVLKQLGQHKPLSDRLRVTMTFFAGSARRYDISNFIKTTEDAITKAGVWQDDSQIDEAHQIRGPIDRENPRCEVEIEVIKAMAHFVGDILESCRSEKLAHPSR